MKGVKRGSIKKLLIIETLPKLVNYSGEQDGISAGGKLNVQKQAVLNAAADADSVCFMDGAEIVCLDRRTGAPRWRAKPPAAGSELWAGTLILRGDVSFQNLPFSLQSVPIFLAKRPIRRP